MGYDSHDSAIQFDGLVEHYIVVWNRNKGYDVSFEAIKKPKMLKINIKIFPSLKADKGISGGSRLGIRYSGKVILP